jgi:hypothetical protein
VRCARWRWAKTDTDVTARGCRERSLHIVVSLFRGFAVPQGDDEDDQSDRRRHECERCDG